MQKRKFTVVTQLHENNNTNLIEYFDTTRVLYAKAMRETFHILKRVNNINKSSYNTYLQKNMILRVVPQTLSCLMLKVV